MYELTKKIKIISSKSELSRLLENILNIHFQLRYRFRQVSNLMPK